MKWFDSWNWVSNYKSQFWDKGFCLLESSKHRSLFYVSLSRSSLAKCYTAMVTFGSEGFELGFTLGKYNLTIGIGARV